MFHNAPPTSYPALPPEDDLKYKEKDDHRHAACDKCYKQVINCRSYILLRDRHPQVVESVTDQRDHNPCDKVPHSLVNRNFPYS